MLDHVDNRIAFARARHQCLLDEARIEQLLRSRKRYLSAEHTGIRRILIGFSNLLIRLGQYIRESCGASPLPIPMDESPRLRTQ